jgi:hypothetical protein
MSGNAPNKGKRRIQMKKRSMLTATAIAVLVGVLVWPLAMQAQSTPLQDLQGRVEQVDSGAANSVESIGKLLQVKKMIEKPLSLTGAKLLQAEDLAADVLKKAQDDVTNFQRNPKEFGDLQGQRGSVVNGTLQSVRNFTTQLDGLSREISSGISVDTLANAIAAVNNAVGMEASAFVAKMSETGERAIGELPELRMEHKGGKKEDQPMLASMDQVAPGAAERLHAERAAWDKINEGAKLLVKFPDGTGKEIEREVGMDYFRGQVAQSLRAPLDAAIARTHTLDITGGDTPDRIMPCDSCSSLSTGGPQSNSVNGPAKK